MSRATDHTGSGSSTNTGGVAADVRATGRSTPDPVTVDGFRRWPLVLGGGIAAVGLAGLLDATGLIDIPPWIVPMIAILALCLTVVASTLTELRR